MEQQPLLPYYQCQKELQELLHAQYPLIFFRSAEESRAINCVIAAHKALCSESPIQHGEIARWSSISGFQKLTDENAWQQAGPSIDSRKDPMKQALDFLQSSLQKKVDSEEKKQYTYILPDWSAIIEPDHHLIARQLKELVIGIAQKRPRPLISLVVIGADWSIPNILRNIVHILDLPLPIGKELYEGIFRIATEKYDLEEEEATSIAEQAQGMPFQSAAQTAKLITTRQLWGAPEKARKLLLEVKKQEIRKTGVLEYFEPQGAGLHEVGGLEEIKAWVEKRQEWFEQDVNPDMIPRAILLEGFPGCGKTFIARAIAQEWGVPQINFEISRLQSKWVGESESNTFRALRAIEASAPNILFMDEIEKAFAGVGGDSSGVSTRQFGTFLSWLNDHNYPIFFIATSNDRSKLPPELFRAGRFDEIFIVMPPNTQERYQILEKRTQAYRLEPLSSTNLDFLVSVTKGFSGAELDKLVKETVYLAGLNTLPTKGHWKTALEKISPQYKTERMQSLLLKYHNLIQEGGGKPASHQEEGFLESLIMVKNP